MTERYFGFPAVVLEAGVKTGMPILYDNPKEVAADRVRDAVGALELYEAPLIVVDFSSTATIFDAISAKGEYLGGTIFPGVEVSLDALVGRAAMLRRVELVEPRSVIGRSVVESIQAGIVYGTVDAVDGIVTRFKKELGDCVVVATGGLAGLVGPLSTTIEHHEPWLTLHGLRTIFEKNRP
jgi:type III pantothenate kinase